jgi:protein disulfide-isomerase A1
LTQHIQAGKSLVYIFALTENERSAYRDSLSSIARKYEEYLSFVTIDAIEYGHMTQALGLDAGVFPALALQNPSFGQVFPYPQRRAITAEAIEKFILDIVEGRTKPGGARTVRDEL